MTAVPKANILLVDDQPAKLLTYEVMLEGLGENLIKADSAREALRQLLKVDVAVILMDVSMPDLDGFQLAAMIRDHPRFRETAIIFVSAIHLNETDYLRGYQMGGVDYVSAPVIAEVLRSKVKVFVELHRKTRQLEAMNDELEKRVEERTEELRLSNEQQRVLAREVDHRAKNALAVAQAIVRLSRADSIEEHVAAIEGRITALARAHTLLSDARWQGASLKTIVEEELAPYRGGGGSRVSIAGPDILLIPASAQAIALVLHELATNAAKYGAFARPSGTLTLSWAGSDPLRLTWLERGVPGIQRPTKIGFGTKVITLSIESQLGGRAEYHWQDDGLRCDIEIPGSHGRPPQAAHPSRADAQGPGKVLVTEDEPLVALMISELARDLGYEIVGPCSSLSEALYSCAVHDLAAAILDVNLAGEMVYPLAASLRQRDVPFLFVTGYAPERIDPTYSDVTVLQKPIDPAVLKDALTSLLDDGGHVSSAA
jgi:two-component sensor histidine kinase/CheY-like chemotaxis protein